MRVRSSESEASPTHDRADRAHVTDRTGLVLVSAPGTRRLATVSPDRWAWSVRYMVNTHLYGCQSIL